MGFFDASVAMVGYIVYVIGYVTVVTISLCSAFIGGSHGGAFIAASFTAALYFILHQLQLDHDMKWYVTLSLTHSLISCDI
jgi:hypothetical protein